jgi:5-methylcytosine-specific restriction endonuclease McrBC regulatory subunit McrC
MRNFYQMFAYGQKYLGGTGEMYLIYPAHDDFSQPIPRKQTFDRSRIALVHKVIFFAGCYSPASILYPSPATYSLVKHGIKDCFKLRPDLLIQSRQPIQTKMAFRPSRQGIFGRKQTFDRSRIALVHKVIFFAGCYELKIALNFAQTC